MLLSYLAHSLLCFFLLDHKSTTACLVCYGIAHLTALANWTMCVCACTHPGCALVNTLYCLLSANKSTADLRTKIANACLDDMVQWFASGGQVGILDGSNTTEERRTELVERFKTFNVHPMFIETICDNPAIIDANIRNVKVSSPDVSVFPPPSSTHTHTLSHPSIHLHPSMDVLRSNGPSGRSQRA
jgi:hypothetical protein